MLEFLLKIFSRRSSSLTQKEEQSLRQAASDTFDASLRDAVTGLFNRKYLLKRLETHMAWCDKSKQKMAVILWDIDGFVDFNNRFGQEEGDRFLKAVADTIKRSLRSTDEAFRCGGDEFCALLIPSDEKVASDVTKRVGQMVEKHLFEGRQEYSNQRFSISSGLVFYPSESNVPEALLHEVGQALYRNRLAKV